MQVLIYMPFMFAVDDNASGNGGNLPFLESTCRQGLILNLRTSYLISTTLVNEQKGSLSPDNATYVIFIILDC